VKLCSIKIKKAVVRKAVCNKTKRKTKNEMVGRSVHGPEKDGFKRMERQNKESRALGAYRRGDQSPPSVVAPFKKKKIKKENQIFKIIARHEDIKESVHSVLYCIIVG
jgi:hypothetical protein